MSNCNICCEKYNKSNRSQICCPYCEFNVCRLCCETYMLNESVAKCMNTTCSKEWSRKFLRENFTHTFLNGKYKEHMEDLLFDREKALLPATQILIERKIKKKNIKNKIKDLNSLINELVSEKHKLENQLYLIDIEGGKDETAEKNKFVRQCPADGCRGFLSTQWKCGICENWTCPDCHQFKGPVRDCGHVCNPDNVASANLLAKDSRPCPKCQSMIFKIDGCDQMWCVQCHTAFSWKTGLIQNGSIHNPHFYEWQRKNGKTTRVPGDIECGRELTHFTTENIYNLIKEKHPKLGHIDKNDKSNRHRHIWIFADEVKYFTKIINKLIHNREYEMLTFNRFYFTKNQDLRISYMEGSISEKEFKTLLQRHDKNHKKNQEIAQVFQIAFIAITDIIYRLIDLLQNSKNIEPSALYPFMAEIREVLLNYCNGLFVDIAFTYRTTTQCRFDENFNFINESIKHEKESSIHL